MSYIKNINFYRRWNNIEKYLTGHHEIDEKPYALVIDGSFLISGKKTKMRLVGELDWAWYTPKTLALAMNDDKVDEYYRKMLNDKRSDPNKWKRRREEVALKSFYAARAGKFDVIKKLLEEA